MIFEGREVIIKGSTSDKLIIALHGGLGNAANLQAKLEPHLPDVMVAYANADSSTVWKAGGKFGYSPSDLLYISGLIYHLLDNYTINEVYLLGHSNGGMMAYRSVNKIPYSFTGVIGISATYFDDFTHQGKVLHIHGLSDLMVPVAGNADYGPLLPNVNLMPSGTKTVLLTGAGHNLDDIVANVDLSKEIAGFVGL